MRMSHIDFHVVAILCTTGELSVFDAESYYEYEAFEGGISPHKAVFQGKNEDCDMFVRKHKDSDLSELPEISYHAGKWAFLHITSSKPIHSN